MAKRGIWVLLAVACVAVYQYVTWRRHVEERTCAQQLYAQAIHLEKIKSFRAEYEIQHYFCNYSARITESQLAHACDRSVVVGGRIRTSYEATMAALAEYRALHGEYPESLDPVLAQMPLATREIAQGFDYYRKRNSADRFAVGRDGKIMWTTSASDVVLISGQYGTLSFDLVRPSIFSFHRRPLNCTVAPR